MCSSCSTLAQTLPTSLWSSLLAWLGRPHVGSWWRQPTRLFHADKLICKQLSLVSTRVAGSTVWLPSPKAALLSTMPHAFRCVAFGAISLKLMGEEKDVKRDKKKKAWHCFFLHFTSCSWCHAHLARFRDSRHALDKNDLNVSSSLQTCLVAFCLQPTSNVAWPLGLPPECI